MSGRLPGPARRIRRPGGHLAGLPQRAALTLRYLGWREVAWRAVTFPLRFTPLWRRLGWTHGLGPPQQQAVDWYRAHGRPVTVVIATHGDPALALDAADSVRRTTDPRRVAVVIADDGSAPEHVERLRARARGAQVVTGENRGYAANCNRGIAAAPPDHDVVLLNSDVVAHRAWLECLAHAAYGDESPAGITGAKLLYPDGRIQSAGTHRNLGAPEWFDHRHRFQPADHGPAGVAWPALAMTGACLYLRRDCLDAVGTLDEGYGMGYEDVDLCLRAWQAGHGVRYAPDAVLTHLESVTRGREWGERELASRDRFWERWGGWLDARDVRVPGGGLRIVYVTEDTGVGGGHRDVFEHCDRLRARGHDVELWSLDGPPEWYELESPVRAFGSYRELAAALAGIDAIKVATWWRTAEPVWEASVCRGIPVFFVQDIETSYYPNHPRLADRVLASYREEFHYMTISRWNRDRLRELGREAELVPPGIDLDRFRPLDGVARRENALLCLGRSNRLKNLDLTVDAWRLLGDRRPELVMFGVEPELGARHGATYVEAPSDAGVNELLCTATAFVATSRHEGFCLPPLEAMAAGCPVVTTDAHGNRDFCEDGVNCLMPDPTPESVAAALERVLGDAALRARLAEAGMRTAAGYAWERRIDALEAFYERIARGGPPPAPQPAGERATAAA